MKARFVLWLVSAIVLADGRKHRYGHSNPAVWGTRTHPARGSMIPPETTYEEEETSYDPETDDTTIVSLKTRAHHHTAEDSSAVTKFAVCTALWLASSYFS